MFASGCIRLLNTKKMCKVTKISSEQDAQELENGLLQADKSAISTEKAGPNQHDPLKLVLWFGILSLVSVGMTIGNKVVMLHFRYPNLVTLLQNASAVALLLLGVATGSTEIKPMKSEQWRTFMVTAVFLTTQIVSSLLALPLVAIATTIVFRNLSTCAVAVIDWACFGKRFSTATASALLLATTGMCIYAGSDVNYDFMGYIWLLVNATATVLNTFWNKFYISSYTQRGEQTTAGISLIQQTETLPLVIALASFNREFGAAPQLANAGAGELVVLAGTCVGGYLISITYTKIYSLASGTSVILASTVNKAISIIGAYFVFGTALERTQVLGLLLCICGGLWYAVESKRSSNK